MTSVQTFALSPNGDFTVGKFGYTATRGTNGVQQVTGGGERGHVGTVPADHMW